LILSSSSAGRLRVLRKTSSESAHASRFKSTSSTRASWPRPSTLSSHCRRSFHWAVVGVGASAIMDVLLSLALDARLYEDGLLLDDLFRDLAGVVDEMRVGLGVHRWQVLHVGLRRRFGRPLGDVQPAAALLQRIDVGGLTVLGEGPVYEYGSRVGMRPLVDERDVDGLVQAAAHVGVEAQRLDVLADALVLKLRQHGIRSGQRDGILPADDPFDLLSAVQRDRRLLVQQLAPPVRALGHNPVAAGGRAVARAPWIENRHLAAPFWIGEVFDPAQL